MKFRRRSLAVGEDVAAVGGSSCSHDCELKISRKCGKQKSDSKSWEGNLGTTAYKIK